MNRISAFLTSIMLLLVSVMGAVPTAHAVGTNLINNPSVEDSVSAQPTGWTNDKWGTNTAVFSYLNNGHTGSHSLNTALTSRSSGDAKWYFTPIVATPNTSYTYSDWYQSTARTSIDVVVTSTAGVDSYLFQGNQAISSAWKQASYTFTTPANTAKITIYHYLKKVGQVTTDDYSLVNNSTTPVPTAPTVSITVPVANATVAGTTTLSANATDAVSVSSVQFKVDGVNVGAADTTSPYSVNWNSTTVANGTHNVTAVATNSSNLTTTSAPVSVAVSNVVAPPSSNLILNPSFETTQNATAPDSWIAGNWGANTSSLSYLTTGHTGNHSVKVQTTQFTNGATNWTYSPVPITAGKTYQYSNWYQSNVDTEVDAEVTMSNGSVQYFWLGPVLANSNWTQFKATFTPPAGAKSVAVYQLLAKTGYIVSDDYSLTEYTPVPYNRGIVSINFDDGWASQYQNANPVLKLLGIKATYYIISGTMTGTTEYMSSAQVKDLYTNGNEIGDHTVSHPDLTTLSNSRVQTEMANSQTVLKNLIGVPVTSFAYPYGAYNANTIAIGKQYFASQRSVNSGLNTRDNFDITQLKIQEVDGNISQAQVKIWIDSAIAQHAWLVLVYHEVANVPISPDDALYTTLPSDFTAEMNYLKSTGVATKTMQQALAEVQAQ